MDAWLHYFIGRYVSIRVGTFALVALAMSVFILGPKVVRLRDRWVLCMLGMILALLMGVALAPDISTQRLYQIAGVIVYFLCGYIFSRWTRDHKVVQDTFLVIGTLYVSVCVVALLKIWPVWFPVIEALWAKGVVIETRPEIMTDQNFQIFYLIPVAVGLLMPLSFRKAIFFGILTLGSLYTLAQLQTRSGALVFGFCLTIGLFATIRNKDMGQTKAIVAPMLGIIAALAALPIIIKAADLLIYRFTDHGYRTAMGRIESITFLIEKIIDPTWWLPRGNEEFVATHGNIPHSNITAYYLEGGLFGLIFWLLLVVIPALYLLTKMVKGGLDAVSASITCGVVSVLLLQMTLNVPAHSQVWLWAGAGIGVIDRLFYEKRTARRSRLLVGI